MRINSKLVWNSNVTITVYRHNHPVEVWRGKNIITDAGLNLLRDCLYEGKDAQIRYIALGLDNTAPAAGDTQLGNEIFRKAPTSTTPTDPGEVETMVYIAPYEANDDLEEIGWFAGEDATDTTDSGILVARMLYSKTKTNLEALQIERDDTIGRVV